MQQAHNNLSQELKATKRAHRLFLSVLEDMGGDLTPFKEELEDLSTKFNQLLDTLATFGKSLENIYNQGVEDDTELENSLA
ncbi:hypothetical protein NHP190012_04120 [Helicobacter sp. NHP19-012]|uniref:Uncharacterized protein n=1 Tax=Helicobacter gastrofelis TaxID=2849642 RepID=A0ABN6I5D0_9HELI|nr:hypothetical protein [Helicobacter sp. NHP19-012]BCZ18770.1 hypothetical protein NHP190012_04120 [Helicobacter sp. NHP19-012]